MYEYPEAPPQYPSAPFYNQGPPLTGSQPPQPTIMEMTTTSEFAEFGERPKRMICPNCRNEIMTTVSPKYSLAQRFATCVMAVCWILCNPCSMCTFDEMANVKHSCPGCRTNLGMYHRRR